MRIEYSTSQNNPGFRIYRIVGGPADLSFVSEDNVRAGEELIIFSGDEGVGHSDTERRVQKLSRIGRLVARDLFRLRLENLYIAIDQLQLTCREQSGWSEHLHQAVVAALHEVLGADVPVAHISWRAMMSVPD